MHIDVRYIFIHCSGCIFFILPALVLVSDSLSTYALNLRTWSLCACLLTYYTLINVFYNMIHKNNNAQYISWFWQHCIYHCQSSSIPSFVIHSPLMNYSKLLIHIRSFLFYHNPSCNFSSSTRACLDPSNCPSFRTIWCYWLGERMRNEFIRQKLEVSPIKIK